MALSEMSTGRSQRVEAVNMEPDQVGNGDGSTEKKRRRRQVILIQNSITGIQRIL